MASSHQNGSLCLFVIIFNHVKEAVIVWQATYKHTEKTALFPFSNDNPGNLLESLFSVHLKYVTKVYY